MDPFDADSQAFLAWLRHSGAEISNKIELKDLRSLQAGRGVGEFGSASISPRAHIPLLHKVFTSLCHMLTSNP